MNIIYAKEIFNYLGNEAESIDRIKDVQKNGYLIESNLDKARSYLELIYTPQYISKVESTCNHRGEIAEFEASPELFESALSSIYTAVQATKEGDFAIVRPPGHHASSGRSKGFCLFNNVAVATKYLLNQDKKVAIIDFDGHHGDGTAKIFQKKPSVIMWSLAQENVYPFSCNIHTENIFVSELMPNSGDDVFEKAFNVIVPRLEKFNPDYIAVSAGFDGHEDDLLLDLKFTTDGYYTIGRNISKLGVPTFAVLEGGYHSKVLDSIDSFVSGFNSVYK